MYAVDSCSVTIYSDATCSTIQKTLPFNLKVCSAETSDDDGYVTDNGAFVSQQTIAVQGFPSMPNSAVMQR